MKDIDLMDRMSSTHNLKFSLTFLQSFGSAVSDLLKHEKLTDLRFISVNEEEGTTKTFNAHQFLFTPKSSFLRTLCTETREKQLISDPVIITLPGISPHSIQALIDYFYFGTTDFELRDDLEDMCLLLGIDDIDLDNNETDIKWSDYSNFVSMDSGGTQNSSTLSIFRPNDDDDDSSLGEEKEENIDTITNSMTDDSKSNSDRRSTLSLKKRVVIGPSTAQRKNKKTRKSNKKTGYLSNGNYLNDCKKCSSIFVAENSYLEHIKKCTWGGENVDNSVTLTNGTSKMRELKDKTIIKGPRESFVMLKRLNVDGYKSPSKNTSPSKKAKLMRCKFCDLAYDKASNLRNHTLNHFKDKLYPDLPACKPYLCPDCSVQMRDRVSLLRHYSYSHRHIYKHCSEEDIKGVAL